MWNVSGRSGSDDCTQERVSAGDLAEMECGLAAVLDRFGLTDAALEMLASLAAPDPDSFFAAGLARLELKGGSLAHRKRSLRLLDAPAFLLELVRSPVFSADRLKEFCHELIREDSLLDVKLARLLPGRRQDDYQLDSGLILRVLGLLDEISQGPRLLMIVGHLTRHPDKRVASKAALLVGRRILSRDWVERHLSSTDSRIRANVVESLWHVNSALAAQTLRRCAGDENNRVRGNALVGLHLLGDRSVDWRIRQLAKDSRPNFRRTAAWVIGTMQDRELIPLLEGLLADPSQKVGRAAAKALQTFGATSPDAAQPPTYEEPSGTAGEEAAARSGDCEQDRKPAEEQLPTQPECNLRLDGRYITGA